MALKVIRKSETENMDIRCCFIEAKKKKALVVLSSCIAEMKILEEGKEIYLNCEWMDQEEDELYFEAAKESIYEFLTFQRDDIEVLEEIREELLDECFSMEEALDSRFKEEYIALAKEVEKMLKEKNFDVDFTEDCYEGM